MFINSYNEEMGFLEDSQKWRGLFPRKKHLKRNVWKEQQEEAEEKTGKS